MGHPEIQLRIIHVVSTFPPYKGGIGNICYQLTQELLKTEYTVKIITLEPKNTKYFREQNNTYRLRPLLRSGNAGWVPQVFWKVWNSDVIHFHYPFIGGEAALLVKLFKPRTKIVISYHMDLYESGFKGYIFKLYQAVALWMIKHLSDTVIFSSLDYGRSSALSSFLKNNPEKCIELPYGVDGKLFHPSDSMTERLANNKVLFVAALDKAHSFKGLPILFQAIADVKDSKLTVAGDGDLRKRYQELAYVFKIEDRVTFIGRVSDQDLAKEFRTSKLFVLPSTTRSEAFGLVILEALCSGIPAIASNLPGVRTVISDGEDGYLVSPGEADELSKKIHLLLENSVLNERLGRAGRQKVLRKYSWPGITQILVKEVY